MDENLSTLSYASKASFISNKPIKNEDPKTQQIADLKRQVKILTEELANANETINFLSSLTGKNPQMIKNNIGGAGQGAGSGGGGPRGSTPTRGLNGEKGGGGPGGAPGGNRNNNVGGSYNGPNGTGNKVLQRQDSAVTQKAGQDGAGGGGAGPNRDEIDRINANRVGTAGTVNTQSGTNNAANETKDAITGRIIHTVNMMKEVL